MNPDAGRRGAKSGIISTTLLAKADFCPRSDWKLLEMAILKEAQNNVLVWQAISRLNSPMGEIRRQAMISLRELGSTAQWQLRIAAQNRRMPNSQIGAAVVLHWLGDEKGMQTLVSCLQSRLPDEPELGPILEYAFVTIGSPDADMALIKVWDELPQWDRRTEIRTAICRVWAKLVNPVVLNTLVSSAIRFPALFEATVPAFGAQAAPFLERMALSPDVQTRMIAMRTLKEIPSERSFAAIVPLLEDPDPWIRSEAPEALARSGSSFTLIRELAKAISRGFATPSAVRIVLTANPPELLPILLSQIESWEPPKSPGDLTDSALVISLQSLENAMMLPFQFITALISLLPKLNSPKVVIGVSKVLGRHGTAQAVRPALLPQLSSPFAPVRTEVAIILERYGDNFGVEFLRFIETCKPQESLLARLGSVIQGGQDSGQAATLVVQQFTGWFNRVSREAADRLNLAPAEVKRQDPILLNPRLPEHLRLLIVSSLNRLQSDKNAEDAEEAIMSCVTSLRAIMRLEQSAGRNLRSELLAALKCFKLLQSRHDVAEAIRLTASETLTWTYGASVFPIFLETLYSTQPPVAKTTILALGQLGDPRALPHLVSIASDVDSSNFGVAQEAIASIKKINPEMMTLLRGSSADNVHPELLLRPAKATPGDNERDLLRPSEKNRP